MSSAFHLFPRWVCRRHVSIYHIFYSKPQYRLFYQWKLSRTSPGILTKFVFIVLSCTQFYFTACLFFDAYDNTSMVCSPLVVLRSLAIFTVLLMIRIWRGAQILWHILQVWRMPWITIWVDISCLWIYATNRLLQLSSYKICYCLEEDDPHL